MESLVQMLLASSGRPTTAEDGIAFIEQFILPSLELCERLQEQRKILADGPMSGAVALALIVRAECTQEATAKTRSPES